MKPLHRFIAALTATTTIHAALAGALMHTESPKPTSRKAEKIAMIDIIEPAADVQKPAAPSPKPPTPPKKKPAPPKKTPKPKAVPKPKPLPKPKPRSVPAPQPKPEPPVKPRPEPPKPAEALEPSAPDTPPPAKEETEAPVAEPSASSASTHRYKAAESYLGRLRQKVQTCLRYPMTARRLRLEGESLLRFIVHGDGSIGALALKRSSGHRTLDEQAIATLEKAAPFEAPPEGKEMTIVLPVSFNLRHGS